MSIRAALALLVLVESTVFLALPVAGQLDTNMCLPIANTATVIENSGDQVCPPQQEVYDTHETIKQNTISVLQDYVLPQLVPDYEPPTTAPLACGDVGWTRVAFLNMSDPAHTCPTGFTEVQSPRSCSKTVDTCDSTTFSVSGQQYSKVCGRAIGYQFARTAAFYGWGATTIDGHYLSGISITHGQAGSRTHIWSFAAGIGESLCCHSEHCPCQLQNPYASKATSPTWVGDDYFCETGNPNTDNPLITHTSDPLWDAQGCAYGSACCDHPVYFLKTLPSNTADDIEVRLCGIRGVNDDNTLLELIELYIQ